MISEVAAGISAYGCYIPAKRLPLALIHDGKLREGGSEKAVAGFDEDVITMGVDAARNCLQQRDRCGIDGVFFATTNSPFREKQAAAFVARALDLRVDVTCPDFTGSLRCAAGAMLAAINAVQADPDKQVLVIAADARLAAPRSPLEANLGDGAAAFLIGSSGVQARLLHAYSRADELYDVWRTEQDDYLRTWEDRFNVMHGYSDNLKARW